ncbi:MAG: hypothetical protein HY678_11915 [Chloroflexi bacterium]|nr:hypothetical protein [Chloroflexota bacterium]
MKRLLIAILLAGLLAASGAGTALAHPGGPNHEPCGNPNLPEQAFALLCGHSN